MAALKREGMSRMVKEWLRTNRHGRLTSDQWLNLIVEPLGVFVVLSVPLLALLVWSPARIMVRYASYTRLIIPLFIVALLFMLVMRARRYATLPLYTEILHARNHDTWLSNRFRRTMTLYSDYDEPMTFSGFVASPPYLEVDMPYRVYYLKDQERLVLLSLAPMEHPDIDLWQPSSSFEARQKKRRK